jgi:hypothetical protein
MKQAMNTLCQFSEKERLWRDGGFNFSGVKIE